MKVGVRDIRCDWRQVLELVFQLVLKLGVRSRCSKTGVLVGCSSGLQWFLVLLVSGSSVYASDGLCVGGGCMGGAAWVFSVCCVVVWWLVGARLLLGEPPEREDGGAGQPAREPAGLVPKSQKVVHDCGRVIWVGMTCR